MNRLRRRAAIAFGLVLFLVAAIRAATSIEEPLPPKPDRYVTDRAGVLPANRAEALNQKLEQFERDTSNQILVWIDRKIPENFTLEDFTVRAAQKWKAGQAKTDNGAVLFVFIDDRKLRIEVGYGLEGVLPDITANRIIQNEIVPRFRSGDYPGGIEAGVDAMITATKGEYKGTGSTVAERSGNLIRDALPLLGFLILIVFPILWLVLIFIVFPIFGRRRWRTFAGSGWMDGASWGGGGSSSGGGGGFGGGGGGFGGGGASGGW
jgi:uncharacterized protein